MPRMRELRSDDPALESLLGDAQSRFAALVAEADERARPFYERTLGQAMGCEEAVNRIVDEVAAEGDAAVVRYAELFDGVRLDPKRIRVDEGAIERAWQAVGGDLRAALADATRRIEAYQQTLIPSDVETDASTPLGVRWTPLERVGAYVPGGTGGSLPLCSTVLMDLVPARVAGVRDLVLTTPSRPDGTLAPEILAACHAAGIREIYAVGGVPAIAAMACGTASIPRVDKIVGPGNLFVTLAKRAVYGRVDIDMLAGPSEVLVIADDSVPPAWIAADLLSQAEHDTLAMSVLLAIGDGVAAAVQEEVERQLDALPEERRTVAAASIERMGRCIVCATVDEAVTIANRFAAEHLELLVADPRPALAALRHAGAIFVGPWSPEPIGDYVAGPSHTLPTGGSARIWSGIGADTFLKRSSIIHLGEADFREMAGSALTLARTEGLEAHARSIEIRLEQGLGS